MIRRIQHGRTLFLSMLLSMLLAATMVLGQNQPLPKPQTASAEGKEAPDFALPDQEGREVKLSSLRGHRVVLIFYRGYW